MKSFVNFYKEIPALKIIVAILSIIYAVIGVVLYIENRKADSILKYFDRENARLAKYNNKLRHR